MMTDLRISEVFTVSRTKEFYNPETESTALYTEVWQPELIQVKELKNLLVLNHYWQDESGDLWGDFEHPMENVRAGFAAYRCQKGYMTPADIRKLRENLNLTVRKFAEVLGIAPSSLTQIENDQRIQVKYQENLFRAAAALFIKYGELPQSLVLPDDELVSDERYSRAINPEQYLVRNYYLNRLTDTDKTFHQSDELGVVV